MRAQAYWTFDQRHPIDTGNISISERAIRFVDRMDDAFTACMVALAYRRISRNL